jgi:tetratricopeptide (TPR) repeat protein
MPPISKTLTGLLEIKDPALEKLRNTILRSFNNTEEVKDILAQQHENCKQTNCFSCNKEAICLFLNGVLYFRLGENDTAIRELETANQHFRNQDEAWNSIVGRAMFGSVCEASGKHHLALREYQKALDILINDYIRLRPTEYVEKASIFKNLLQDQIECCSSPHPKTPPPKSARSSARLTIPWLQTAQYPHVYADPKAPVLGESFERNGASVDEIILEGKPYQIYSSRHGDNLITLTSERQYLWAKVAGNSMNAAKPVPIVEGDFVLLYNSNDANHGTIVVASLPDNSGSGDQLVVKRYSKTNRMLISETSPPDLYAPMPAGRDTRIIGVVIAVAKPDDGAEHNHGKQKVNTPGDSQSRYDELAQLLHGDISAADRLIGYERVLSPQLKRDDWIERAINKLLRDRRT